MTDRKTLHDPNEPPEDVASLYSWANLHGAKYRDFSASRAQNREKARLEMQQAIDEQERAQRGAELQQAEAARRAEAAMLAGETGLTETETHRAASQAAWQSAQQAAQQAAEQAARQAAAHEAAQRAAQQAAQQAAEEMARQAAQQARAAQAQAAQQAAQQAAEQAARQAAHEAAQRAAQHAAQQAAQEMARQAAQQARAAQVEAAQHAEAARAAQLAAQQAAWQQPVPERTAQPSPRPAAPHPPPQPPAFLGSPPAQPLQQVILRDESSLPPARTPWSAPEGREIPARPAWLAERPTLSGPIVPPAPEDTLQGSRDRLTSRWFALRGVFDSDSIRAAEAAPADVAPRAPVLAVCSLAGGVGKTSLVATLARALSSRGERVLLVDTAPFGLLPFFFGARDQRPGQLRTFNPPAASGDAPIQMITVDPESLGPENGGQEPLTGEIQQYIRGVGRVIVDLATASGSTTRRILRLSPLVLVPVIPDMNSVVSVGSIDAFFERNRSLAGKPVLPQYVLNQFDASLPLHLDVREVLREQLGDRLLPFALRRSPAVSEALAEGMTVMDYAPNSTVAEDFGSLAGWVKSQSASAGSGFRGVRWSER